MPVAPRAVKSQNHAIIFTICSGRARLAQKMSLKFCANGARHFWCLATNNPAKNSPREKRTLVFENITGGRLEKALALGYRGIQAGDIGGGVVGSRDPSNFWDGGKAKEQEFRRRAAKGAINYP